MRKATYLAVLSCAMMLLVVARTAFPCTNLLVTKGASVDGSVMITYTCDGRFHPTLEYTPVADHEPGDSLEITDWSDKLRGKVAQVPHTYAVVDMMNEHQLAISETTFDGRLELRNPDAVLHYWDLIMLALQRAKTARQAIMIMTELVDEYGYGSTGESFSIADTKEAWIMEMIGSGPDIKGAHWVAVRVPDGMISAHANKARIGEFPLDDPDNCLYSDNVISFAIDNGFHDPNSDRPFRFCEAYCPATPKNQRYADARVWSLFRRAAPSLNLTADYHRAVPDAEPYPLWVKPDEKIGLGDVFSLMRDHYEGTPYDMTQGIDAGPFGTPNRWRPMQWRPDSTDSLGPEYAWERPISTQQTGFSFVSQSRDWLPDKVGGIYWYGLDDTYTTCYMPLYCGINAIPESFTKGQYSQFSWESAWWVFNFVANYANLKYSLMLPEIQAVQNDIEGNFIALQPAVEKTAMTLAESSPELLTRYLTDYSVSHAEQTVVRWRALGEHLVTKYVDGYVKGENGRAQEVGYPESWLREVLKSRPEQFRLPDVDTLVSESRLVD